MMLAIPMAPTSSATAPSPSSSVVNCPLAAARASSASDGRDTSTPLAFCGSAVGASRSATCVDVVDVGPHVDLRRIGLGLEQALGDRQRDEHGGVERRVQQGRLHDPDHVEPGVAQVHQDVAADRVDLQDAGRLGPEHDLGIAAGHGVEEVARRPSTCPSPAGGSRRRRRHRCRRSAAAGTNGVRSTIALETWYTATSLSTLPMWSIIGTEVLGRTSLLPVKVVPGVTVSRFVPSASIVASRLAWLEADTPTTATIAPIPIAIPSADSAARSRRVRSPCSATPISSRGGRRAISNRAPAGRAGRQRRSPLTVRDDLAVVHLDAPREGRGDPGSWVIRTRVAPSEASSCRRSTTSAPDFESRLPVGSSARMISGRLAIARAIATRWRSPPESCGGRWVSRCPSPTRSSAARAASLALARAGARVEHAGGDVVDRGHRVLEVEGLKHEADPMRTQSGQLAVGGGGDVVTGDADLAAGRPLERAEDGEHRRLARSRRSDHRHLVADRRSRR